MAFQDFVIDLMEDLLHDAELDTALDDHIRWRNARYYNENSNVVRNSLLIVQLSVGESAEYINFHVGDLYRVYRQVGDMALALYLSLGKANQGGAQNIISDMVHPVNGRMKLSTMRRNLADTNQEFNQNGELLTRQIYRYSRDTKELTVV